MKARLAHAKPAVIVIGERDQKKFTPPDFQPIPEAVDWNLDR